MTCCVVPTILFSFLGPPYSTHRVCVWGDTLPPPPKKRGPPQGGPPLGRRERVFFSPPLSGKIFPRCRCPTFLKAPGGFLLPRFGGFFPPPPYSRAPHRWEPAPHPRCPPIPPKLGYFPPPRNFRSPFGPPFNSSRPPFSRGLPNPRSFPSTGLTPNQFNPSGHPGQGVTPIIPIPSLPKLAHSACVFDITVPGGTLCCNLSGSTR